MNKLINKKIRLFIRNKKLCNKKRKYKSKRIYLIHPKFDNFGYNFLMKEIKRNSFKKK